MNQGVTKPKVYFSRKFARLFEKARYKCYYGGRGGAKSHTIAAALILICSNKRTRVVCARQFQKSIKDSVKELLEIKIKELGLEAAFDVLTTEIVCKTTGSRITFIGLQRNPQSVKSLEGCDICWVEEARTVSNDSMELLVPTIRKPGSEIWFSYNPVAPDDPVDVYFRGPILPKDAIIECVSWRDNPYFNATEMPDEMELLKKKDIQKYRHVWEGEYDEAVESRIFKNWRIGRLPVPEKTPPRFGLDFGYQNSPNAFVKVYFLRATKQIYICSEGYGLKTAIEDIPSILDDTLEARDFTIHADSARPETINYLNGKGFSVVAAKKGPGSIREGITWLQGYEIVIAPECVHVQNQVRLYSWQVDPLTHKILKVPQDYDDDYIDAIRYATEEDRGGGVVIRRVRFGDRRRR